MPGGDVTLTYDEAMAICLLLAENADVASSKRDAAIREAHRAGSSLREIADASGISHMTVKRIIERTAG